MTDRPILFSAPMVRAILAGTKTQTRRIIKGDLAEAVDFMGGADGGDDEPGIDLRWGECHDDDGKAGKTQWIACCADYPEEGFIELGNGYGAVGDRLWVRETWAHNLGTDGGHLYRADHGSCSSVARADLKTGEWTHNTDRWRPSIHMPRAASRITLNVTGVRVERLSSISETDAVAEGAQAKHTADADFSARDAFRVLWESINGGGSWEADPWVWVVEFERAAASMASSDATKE